MSFKVNKSSLIIICFGSAMLYLFNSPNVIKKTIQQNLDYFLFIIGIKPFFDFWIVYIIIISPIFVTRVIGSINVNAFYFPPYSGNNDFKASRLSPLIILLPLVSTGSTTVALSETELVEVPM